MKLTNKARLFGFSELMLGFVVMVLVIMLGNRFLSSVRLDMTENKIYSVSQGTKNILQGLNEPISLKYFYSRKLSPQLPGVAVYADRVSDLIKEYQRIASGKIRVEYVDPEPFSEQEDVAVANGVNGVSIDQLGNSFYLGLVGTNSIDGREVIPFFSPEREQQLEYDLTRLVQRLASSSENKIGVLTTLAVQGDPQAAMFGMPSESWFSLEQLAQLYKVSYLEPGLDTIDQNLSVLLVIHPATLSRETLFAIDQYALNGGKIIMFIDPLAESDQGRNDAPLGDPEQLNKLLAAWGVNFSTQNVVADMQNALRVQSNATRQGEVIDYPVWFMLGQDSMNADDPVLQQLGDVVIASSGVLNKAQASTTEFTPLITTSDTAALINLENLQFQTDPKEVLKLYTPGDEKLTVAARLSGPASTAFPDYTPEKPIDQENEQQADEPQQEQQVDTQPPQTNSGDINVVLITDSDLLRDQFWVQVQNFFGNRLAVPSAGNGKLIANLVDQMSGSPDLISVRNRGSANRPFTLLDSIRQTADQNFLKKEQELIAELQETENKLLELEQSKDSANSALLSQDQQQEIDNFTRKKLDIRKQLRQVRHSLQNDIERVETVVKVANMALVPLLIIIIGLITLVIKSRRSG